MGSDEETVKPIFPSADGYFHCPFCPEVIDCRKIQATRKVRAHFKNNHENLDRKKLVPDMIHTLIPEAPMRSSLLEEELDSVIADLAEHVARTRYPISIAGRPDMTSLNLNPEEYIIAHIVILFVIGMANGDSWKLQQSETDDKMDPYDRVLASFEQSMALSSIQKIVEYECAPETPEDVLSEAPPKIDFENPANIEVHRSLLIAGFFNLQNVFVSGEIRNLVESIKKNKFVARTIDMFRWKTNGYFRNLKGMIKDIHMAAIRGINVPQEIESNEKVKMLKREIECEREQERLADAYPNVKQEPTLKSEPTIMKKSAKEQDTSGSKKEATKEQSTSKREAIKPTRISPRRKDPAPQKQVPRDVDEDEEIPLAKKRKSSTTYQERFPEVLLTKPIAPAAVECPLPRYSENYCQQHAYRRPREEDCDSETTAYSPSPPPNKRARAVNTPPRREVPRASVQEPLLQDGHASRSLDGILDNCMEQLSIEVQNRVRKAITSRMSF
ncbi:hypothetical protein HDU97_006902 [Phlyctochytrium planicorne]|nr:hypothetical protein HDU97_006902 [Phlyctochytrium planicorne]